MFRLFHGVAIQQKFEKKTLYLKEKKSLAVVMKVSAEY